MPEPRCPERLEKTVPKVDGLEMPAAERFETKDSDLRALRGIGAVTILFCAALLFAMDGGVLRYLLLTLCLLFGLGWVMAAGRPAGADVLSIDATGISLTRKKKSWRIDWVKLDEVEVEEEKLVVRLHAETTSWDIPANFGIDLYELADLIRRRHAQYQPAQSEAELAR